MFRIAVCDDQKQIRKELCRGILAYKNQYNVSDEEWSIEEYTEGDSLLAEPERKDVYFLDLEMPGRDGIAVAKMLKKRWTDCTIIILTSHVERMKEGYKINAFRYMTKPISFEELAEGLGSLWSSQIGCDVVNLQKMGHTFQVRQRDIRYLCREDGDTVLYVKDVRFTSRQALDEWEQELNGILFFRCHKGYLVNMGCISDIDGCITLDNGEKVPIARRKRKLLIEKNIEFDLKYGEGF